MKLWEGRFDKQNDSLMERFNNSLPVDKILIKEDIAGSIAWAQALAKARVISSKEKSAIVRGLTQIQSDYSNGKIKFVSSDEDIHTAVERLLSQKIGSAGQRLHTGRSRNDQVATDCRMYVMRKLWDVRVRIINLQKALLEKAEKSIKVIMPGYTHLQQAQPILFSHYWLSFLFLLEREKSRIDHARVITDILPLGSGALAGSGFAVDRKMLARELGFSRISDNSIDGVASRDFILESLSSLSSLGIHLSRYAEDLILWSSKEFAFIELDEAWSTGSSMMPQKKNPDSLELIRGKTGRFIGNYARFAATLKGLGLAYYKDLQEDKEALFDSISQMEMVLEVFTKVIVTLHIKPENIAQRLDPFLLATDLADYLVEKKVPFRKAHAVIGSVVKHCIKNDISLTDLSLKQLQSFSTLFQADVRRVFSWEHALKRRNIPGGTGRISVAAQIKQARKLVV